MPLYLLLPAAVALLIFAERSLIGLTQLGVLVLAWVLAAAGWLRPGLAIWWYGREASGAWRKLWRAQTVALMGLGLYAGTKHAWLPDVAELQALVAVVYCALVTLGLLESAALEQALAVGRYGPVLHQGRIRQALRGARLVGLTLIIFTAINFVAERHGQKVDLSYFHTTRLGEATRRIARGIGQPVTISCFFAPGNAVGQTIDDYVAELCQQNPAIARERFDHALAPERARALGVRHNGSVVFSSGEQREILNVPTDFEEARGVLKRLDSEMQRRLLGALRPPKLLYVTTGHHERDIHPSAEDKRPGLGDFRALAENLGFAVKRLGLAEGLGHEVPGDAAVVAVMGPTQPLHESERAALERYLMRGGRMLLALDPFEGALEAPLLQPLGVSVDAAWVGNSHFTVRTAEGVQNPFNLVTTKLSSHPSVRTLEENPGRMGLILLGAGPVRKLPDAPSSLRLVPTVFSMPESFSQLTPRPQLQRRPNAQSFVLAMAAEGHLATGDQKVRPLRAVVVGDVDFATRSVVRNPGNAAFVADGLRWLTGDETEAGLTASEEDVPLAYRTDADAVGFYGVTFGVPLVVLAVGLSFGPRRPKKYRRPQGDA